MERFSDSGPARRPTAPRPDRFGQLLTDARLKSGLAQQAIGQEMHGRGHGRFLNQGRLCEMETDIRKCPTEHEIADWCEIVGCKEALPEILSALRERRMRKKGPALFNA